MVAMFMHVLSHDVKNRIFKGNLYGPNCLGVLDGTYIKVNVPVTDRPTFRMRKREIATNVRACATRKEISFMSSPVGKDPRQTRGFYVMPFHEKMDYKCQRGFLVPYRGQRYHLQEWCGAGNAPTNAKEYFNITHSSTRNVIERAFDVLKGRWAILRRKSYYPLQVQCRTILAYCLLHNLINREMIYCDDVDDVDEGDSTYATTTALEDIHYIEMTNEWSQWRDKLAGSMFTDCQLHNA
ncbi:retrotransposon protein [Cucumis melo var. makuwa]|uniref:Retrotransposon protein n=1 Tax=Cucumis melo var. makuwa TaxID=1194695 RepID=A0A5D3E3N6_CUCMM|nr:retrotransposon protein [Cucumis melo var. makuwa]